MTGAQVGRLGRESEECEGARGHPSHLTPAYMATPAPGSPSHQHQGLETKPLTHGSWGTSSLSCGTRPCEMKTWSQVGGHEAGDLPNGSCSWWARVYRHVFLQCDSLAPSMVQYSKWCESGETWSPSPGCHFASRPWLESFFRHSIMKYYLILKIVR